MINRCIEQGDVFGLVLLGEGAHEESEATILRVGVTARVVQVERLEDGRMNILCAGESRFHVQEFTGKTPYWTAIVEFFDDEPEREEALHEAYEEVSSLYRQAVQLTSELKEAEIPEVDFPDSPQGLSFMISYVLDLDAARKQELLETPSTLLRLNALAVDLEKIVAHLRSQIARKDLSHKAKSNGHLGKPH